MKKRSLFVSVYICLLLSFLCGMVELIAAEGARPSESENRMLQGMPVLTLSAVRDGVFMDELEAYLSDTFFFRDATAHFTDSVMGVFSLPQDGPDTGGVDQARLFAPDDAASTPAPTETPPADTPFAVLVPEAEPSPTPAAEPSPTPEAEASPAPAASAAPKGPTDPASLTDVTIYLVDNAGKQVVLQTYPAAELAAFVDVLNAYRAALPPDGTLNFCVPPVSAIANNLTNSKQYVDWGSNLEDVLQGAVDDGVYIYDVTDILRPYFGKARLYPVIDHHWHPFSASMVAQAMLERQGVAPMDYYEYTYYISTTRSVKPFYGDELRSKTLPIDTVEIMEPVSPVEGTLLRQFQPWKKTVFVDRSIGALSSYLGGMGPGPWRIYQTGFHTGRNAAVIGDSFELTFTPFLAPYYDTILVTDLRSALYHEDEAGGSIRDYLETYGIDDIYMLYSTYSPFCGQTNLDNLRRYLD